MRSVILQEFISLDGLAAGPNDTVDFIPASTKGDESFGRRQMRFLDTIDAILLGRVTYEMFAAYWPKVDSGEDKEFADKLNAIPKIVFSQTLERAPWGRWNNATIVRDRAETEVAKLRERDGKNMVIWGSISLAQSITDAGLIDELQLVVCPVVLGAGTPLFLDRVDAFKAKLLGTESFDRGTVLLAYAGTETFAEVM